MTTILRLTTSLFADAGNSTKLVDSFIDNLYHSHPDSHVIERDLVKSPLPHLDGVRVGALFSAPESRTADQQAVIDESDALIAEIKAADIIVLGLPMYNFGIPSQLKSYFDHLARAGVTFRYTAEGPVGLVGDRKVYVLATRGGYYQGTPRDSQTPYVRDFLNFIGIQNVEFIYAEGLNVNPEAKEKALAQATAEIKRLAEEVIITRVPQIPIGEKLTLARRGPSRVAGAILAEGHVQAVKLALANAFLSEGQVLKVIANPATPARVISAIAQHPKWSIQYNVRVGLLRNAHTPPPSVLAFLPNITLRDLRDVVVLENIPVHAKRYMEKELARRQGSAANESR